MGIFNSLLKGLGFEDKPQSSVNNNFDDDIIYENNKVSSAKNVNLNSLVIYSPKNNKEVKMLVDCVKRGQACIVNLENLKAEESSRILDFLSGALFALNGKINRLQKSIYVLLPSGVSLTTI